VEITAILIEGLNIFQYLLVSTFRSATTGSFQILTYSLFLIIFFLSFRATVLKKMRMMMQGKQEMGGGGGKQEAG
jgi:hypothetical protein